MTAAGTAVSRDAAREQQQHEHQHAQQQKATSACDSCHFADDKMAFLREETRKRGFPTIDGVHMGPCELHRRHAHTIGPDGALYACPGFAGETSLAVGDIKGHVTAAQQRAGQEYRAALAMEGVRRLLVHAGLRRRLLGRGPYRTGRHARAQLSQAQLRSRRRLAGRTGRAPCCRRCGRQRVTDHARRGGAATSTTLVRHRSGPHVHHGRAPGRSLVSFVGFCRTSHSSFSVRCSSVHPVRSGGSFPALYPRRREKTMTITIINKATRREQQQNGPCPYLSTARPSRGSSRAASAEIDGGGRGRFRDAHFHVRHE